MALAVLVYTPKPYYHVQGPHIRNPRMNLNCLPRIAKRKTLPRKLPSLKAIGLRLGFKVGGLGAWLLFLRASVWLLDKGACGRKHYLSLVIPFPHKS